MALDPQITVPILSAAYGAPLVVAALWDLRTYRIPNLLSALLALGFVPAALLAPGSVDWALHLAAGAGVFLLGALTFALRWMGAGDVKLGAAVALWAGPMMPELLLGMALVGGGLALVLLVVRRVLAGVLLLALPHPERIALPRVLICGEGVPFGIAIAGAGLYVAPRLPLFLT